MGKTARPKRPARYAQFVKLDVVNQIVLIHGVSTRRAHSAEGRLKTQNSDHLVETMFKGVWSWLTHHNLSTAGIVLLPI